MTPPDPTRDALAASLRATLTDARYTSSRGIGIRDLPPHAIDGILPTVVDAVASLLATSRAATVEACAKAQCEWCRKGSRLATPADIARFNEGADDDCVITRPASDFHAAGTAPSLYDCTARRFRALAPGA